MKILKKGICILFIFFILLIPFITSQGVVEVSQQTEPAPNYFTDAFSFLQSKVIVTVVVVLALSIALLIGAFFLVKWIVQFIKKRSDIFYQLKKERIKLASTQRRYPANHWLKTHKNVPIRLVKKDGERLTISSPIGYYKGDYITHEGNFILSLNIVGNKMWFLFPITDLLILPNRKEVIIKQGDKKTDKASKKEEKITLPLAKDIIQFNENEVLIFAESISNTGMFYIPVMKCKDGKVIDLTLPIYDSLKNVVLGDYLYEQTSSFSQLAKKSMDINPYIRSAVKVSDTNQNVEVPSGSSPN